MSNWYQEGMISLVNGSKTVTGTGTAWADNVAESNGLDTPNGLKEIESVTSNTSLQLVKPYAGPTVNGIDYAVIPTQGVAVSLVKRVVALLSGIGVMKDDYQAGGFVKVGDLVGKLDASALSADDGTSNIGFKQLGDGALLRVLTNKIQEVVSLFDYIPETEHAQLRAGLSSFDCVPAINRAIAGRTRGFVILPPGIFNLSSIFSGTGNEATYIVPKSNVHLIGSGDASVLRVANGQNALYRWNVILTPGKLESCIFRDFKLDGNGSNNLLASGVSPRSNRMISATQGGKNITIDNVTFTGCPGNSPVAFSADFDCGNIRVKDCRFFEMGAGIPGNYCIDHTDVYLCGTGNKTLNNLHRSTNFVPGAAFELHGDQGEAAGNIVYGYSQAAWIAPVEQPIFTHTSVHHNRFYDIYTAVSFSDLATSRFGTVDIHDNVFTMKAGAYAAGIRIFGLYGPDEPGAFAEQINYVRNRVIGVPGEAVTGLQPFQTRGVTLKDNHIENFQDGIVFSSSGGRLGDGYDFHDVKITGNTVKNCAGIAMRSLNSKIKKFAVNGGNLLISDTVLANGMVFTATVDGGDVSGNSIDLNYSPYPLAVGAGMAKASFDQAGALNVRYVRYSAANAVIGLNKVIYESGTGIPTGALSAPGDIKYPLVPVVGQPRAWRCTQLGNPGTWVSEGNL